MQRKRLDLEGVREEDKYGENSLFAILKDLRITTSSFNPNFIPFMLSQTLNLFYTLSFS